MSVAPLQERDLLLGPVDEPARLRDLFGPELLPEMEIRLEVRCGLFADGQFEPLIQNFLRILIDIPAEFCQHVGFGYILPVRPRRPFVEVEAQIVILVEVFEQRPAVCRIVGRNQVLGLKSVVPPAYRGGDFVPLAEPFLQTFPVLRDHVEFEVLADHGDHMGIELEILGHRPCDPVVQDPEITVGELLPDDFDDFVHPFVIALRFGAGRLIGVDLEAGFAAADVAGIVDREGAAVQIRILFQILDHVFRRLFRNARRRVAGLPVEKAPVLLEIHLRRNAALAVDQREKFGMRPGILLRIDQIPHIVDHFQHAGNGHAHAPDPLDRFELLRLFGGGVPASVGSGELPSGQGGNACDVPAIDPPVALEFRDHHTEFAGHQIVYAQILFQKIRDAVQRVVVVLQQQTPGNDNGLCIGKLDDIAVGFRHFVEELLREFSQSHVKIDPLFLFIRQLAFRHDLHRCARRLPHTAGDVVRRQLCRPVRIVRNNHAEIGLSAADQRHAFRRFRENEKGREKSQQEKN